MLLTVQFSLLENVLCERVEIVSSGSVHHLNHLLVQNIVEIWDCIQHELVWEPNEIPNKIYCW